MKTKYGKVLGIFIICYAALHMVITLYNNRTVQDHREIMSLKEHDGPLIMRDIEESRKNGRSNIIVVNSYSVLMGGNDDIKIDDNRNITLEVPLVSSSFKEVFRKKYEAIRNQTNDFLLFTLVNKAYLNLTCNWLCNVAEFKSGIIDKTLIVSLDQNTCLTIGKQWPEVQCVVFNSTDEYNQPLKWGHQDYINILTLRIQLMRILVEANIPYVLFETDASWLRNPMEFFNNQTLIDDADIIVPIKGYPDKGQTYTFDPMIVYPTSNSKMLFQLMESRLLANSKLFDQDLLDELCRTQYNGIICRQFEWKDIADGKWFKLAESERSNIRPYIVNNNYYVGVTNKASRQALNGLWFLSPRGLCMRSKVEHMLRKYSSLEESGKAR